MSTTSGNPDPNTELDEEGRAVPPYEGRQAGQTVQGSDATQESGAAVGGARGPAESDGPTRSAPESTERGATASPGDEQPADEAGGDDPGEAATGPSHTPGSTRAEDAGKG